MLRRVLFSGTVSLVLFLSLVPAALASQPPSEVQYSSTPGTPPPPPAVTTQAQPSSPPQADQTSPPVEQTSPRIDKNSPPSANDDSTPPQASQAPSHPGDVPRSGGGGTGEEATAASPPSVVQATEDALPFTGFEAGLVVLGGAALAGVGLGIRRYTRSRTNER
jgi:hypothetical protein